MRRIQVTLIVDYDSSTVDNTTDLARQLTQNLEWAIGNGLLTAGHEDVEVDGYDIRTTRIYRGSP